MVKAQGWSGVPWVSLGFLVGLFPDWTDCVPDTVGFASRDSPGRKWRDACGGISASPVRSACLDCPIGCDRVPPRILLAFNRSVVRGKWRVECWSVAWGHRYPAVSALEEVSCGLRGRL